MGERSACPTLLFNFSDIGPMFATGLFIQTYILDTTLAFRVLRPKGKVWQLFLSSLPFHPIRLRTLSSRETAETFCLHGRDQTKGLNMFYLPRCISPSRAFQCATRPTSIASLKSSAETGVNPSIFNEETSAVKGSQSW